MMQGSYEYFLRYNERLKNKIRCTLKIIIIDKFMYIITVYFEFTDRKYLV